jgi:hypothetical protein
MDHLAWHLINQWRAFLSLAISSILSYQLVHYFSWLTGVQGIGLALLGIIPGLIWEANVDRKRKAANMPQATKTSPPETTTATTFAFALVIGTLWGGFSSETIHSIAAGAIIFILAAWCWGYAAQQLQWVNEKLIFSCAFIAALAYLIVAPIAHLLL